MSDNIERYDRFAKRISEDATDQFKRRAYDRARFDVVMGLAQSDAPILDVGCGTGHAVDYLCQLGRKTLGVDQSTGMLAEARARFEGREFEQADLHKLEYADNTLGGMIAAWSLIHLARSELAPVLTRLAKPLKPGAPLLLVLFQGDGEASWEAVPGEPSSAMPVTLYQRTSLQEQVEQTGAFEVVRVEGRRPYPFEAPLFHIFLTAKRL